MTLKVIQFLPSLRGGGVEIGTLEVAKALVQAGHESLVVSAGGPMVESLEADGSTHIRWDLGKKSPLSFRHIWALRRWLREQRADVVHVRSRMPAWIVYLAWRGMPENERPRFMTTMHGLHSVSAYSEIMCRGERVIAVSKTVEEYIAKNYPRTDMSRVRLVNRGVSDEEYPWDYCPDEQWLSQWRNEFPQFAGKRLICLPGRLTRLKGHRYFLNLMAALSQRFDDVHGIVVGSEDPKRQGYAKELVEQVKAMGLQDQLTFTGGRGDMKNIYSQSAMVLSLSSKPESFGRTTTEALSMGVPVVGFDHGGVGEQLQSLFPMGRVPCFDESVLLSKVDALLHQPEKPKKNDCYLKSKMLAQTLTIYQELASTAQS
ncbi:glycosyltransferase family 4 protein [Pseudoteredinibacter isoporae]|uniref:glycosyltransferase family 4 protein n=1 Tax=Pseudoteredinibacter isoporae TaxID=570281 RepID=UPI003107B384